MILKIYTDGSHLKHTTGRMGIGGVLVKDGKIIKDFSTEVTQEFLRIHYGTSDVSNPTCEMLAVLVALGEFKKELRDAKEILCYSDYQGVQGWLSDVKPWKITKPYIKAIKDDIVDEINNQNLIGKIKFIWVKGHQTGIQEGTDAYFNSVVDNLAKGNE